MDKEKNLVFIWSSFLSYHHDKAGQFLEEANFCSISSYEKNYYEIQKNNPRNLYGLKILFPGEVLEDVSFLKRQIKLFKEIIKRKEKFIFLGNGGNMRAYHPAIFIGSLIQRFFGKKVFVMFDTNFSDRQRNVFIEVAKAFFFLPYSGAICSSPSTSEYLNFLGFKKKPKTNFGLNTINPERFLSIKKEEDLQRDQFVYVGRMSPEKNISFLLNAYSEYLKKTSRKKLILKLIGDGPMFDEYKNLASELNIEKFTFFVGAKSSQEIAEELNKSKALLFPSLSEPWGIVVNEAVSLSVPVIISEKVNSRSLLVRQMVNGFCLEPDNHEGWVKAMMLLAEDDELYDTFSSGAKNFWDDINVKSFRKAVEYLTK